MISKLNKVKNISLSLVGLFMAYLSQIGVKVKAQYAVDPVDFGPFDGTINTGGFSEVVSDLSSTTGLFVTFVIGALTLLLAILAWLYLTPQKN